MERLYIASLVLLLAAVSVFGVVAVLDDPNSAGGRVLVARLVVPAVDGATGAPVSGERGGDAAGSTGGAGAVAGTTVALPATAAGGGTTAAPAPVTHADRGPVVADLPGGRSPACVDGSIRIGQIVPVTGPVAVQTAAQAVAAYFKKVNSEGGINGCRVDFTYLDDAGLDQQKAAEDARELVQQDQVFAMVGNFEPVTSATTEPYFRREGVPVVGADGLADEEFGSPVEYTFGISPAGFGIATANMAKRLGRQRLAVFYVDVPSIQASFSALRQQAAANGQQIVYSNAENVASATYGTDVVAAKDSDPDIVVNILDANSVVREMNAMSSSAWYPDVVGTTGTSDPVVVQQEAQWESNPAHHVYVLRPYLPATADTPEVREWIQTEDRYFPGFDPNSYAEGAWLGAKVFTEVARSLGPGLTRQSLMAALNGLHGFHTGFTPDITMTPDHGPNRQALWMRWDGAAQQYQQMSAFQPW